MRRTTKKMGCYGSKLLKNKKKDESLCDSGYSTGKETTPPESEEDYYLPKIGSSLSDMDSSTYAKYYDSKEYAPTLQEMDSSNYVSDYDSKEYVSSSQEMGSGTYATINNSEEYAQSAQEMGSWSDAYHSQDKGKETLIFTSSGNSSLSSSEIESDSCSLLDRAEVLYDSVHSFYSDYNNYSRGPLADEVAFMCLMPSVMPKTSSPKMKRRMPMSGEEFALFTAPSGSIHSLIEGDEEVSYNCWIDDLELTPTYAHSQNITKLPEALSGQFTRKGFPVSFTDGKRLAPPAIKRKIIRFI